MTTDLAAPVTVPDKLPADIPPVALPPPVKALALYSEALKETILDHYIQGTSIRKIAALPGMPSYGTLLRWVQHHDGFRAALADAAKARALHFADEALDEAMGALGKDDAPAARLKFEALRWRAETEDPMKYGKRTTVAGDPDRPVVFVVRTGVPAPEEHQKPPELQADGIQKAVIEAAAQTISEVADAE
jgi:hypothetical protein